MLTLYSIRMSHHISWLHSLRHSASMQLALFLQTTAHTKHGFIIQIDVVIRPWPTSQSKTSAPGTLISFINPLWVENHDFDGIELGSYIVYWSMIKYHVIDDWRSFSLESIHRFLPWNSESATSKILSSFTDCLRLWFRMVRHSPSWSCLVYLLENTLNISKFSLNLLIIKTSTRKKVCCQPRLWDTSSSWK